jgi:hypothetical protein
MQMRTNDGSIFLTIISPRGAARHRLPGSLVAAGFIINHC